MAKKITTILRQVFFGFVVCGGILSIVYLSVVKERVDYSVHQQELSDSTIREFVKQRDSLFRIVLNNQTHIAANQDTLKALMRASY